MIDNINLTFSPETREEYQLYEFILSKFQYRRNMIIENLTSDIKLFIFTNKKFIQIKVFHLCDFLNCHEITNRDYYQFENQLNKVIEPLGLQLHNLSITRVDYKLDLKLSPIELQEYLYIFSKLRQKYYSLEKRVYYTDDKSNIESVYYKGSKFNINVYNKETQLNSKGINDPKYDNTLRVELQVKSRELTKYCKAQETTKELINFWHTSVRDEFFNDILIDKFLYTGDYYNFKNVKKRISNMKVSMQQKILKFLQQIEKSDITQALNTLSRNAATKYINELADRNINPIIIKNLDRLLGIKSILEEKSKENNKEKEIS